MFQLRPLILIAFCFLKAGAPLSVGDISVEKIHGATIIDFTKVLDANIRVSIGSSIFVVGLTRKFIIDYCTLENIEVDTGDKTEAVTLKMGSYELGGCLPAPEVTAEVVSSGGLKITINNPSSDHEYVYKAIVNGEEKEEDKSASTDKHERTFRMCDMSEIFVYYIKGNDHSAVWRMPEELIVEHGCLDPPKGFVSFENGHSLMIIPETPAEDKTFVYVATVNDKRVEPVKNQMGVSFNECGITSLRMSYTRKGKTSPEKILSIPEMYSENCLQKLEYEFKEIGLNKTQLQLTKHQGHKYIVNQKRNNLLYGEQHDDEGIYEFEDCNISEIDVIYYNDDSTNQTRAHELISLRDHHSYAPGIPTFKVKEMGCSLRITYPEEEAGINIMIDTGVYGDSPINSENPFYLKIGEARSLKMINDCGRTSEPYNLSQIREARECLPAPEMTHITNSDGYFVKIVVPDHTSGDNYTLIITEYFSKTNVTKQSELVEFLHPVNCEMNSVSVYYKKDEIQSLAEELDFEGEFQKEEPLVPKSAKLEPAIDGYMLTIGDDVQNTTLNYELSIDGGKSYTPIINSSSPYYLKHSNFTGQVQIRSRSLCNKYSPIFNVPTPAPDEKLVKPQVEINNGTLSVSVPGMAENIEYDITYIFQTYTPEGIVDHIETKNVTYDYIYCTTFTVKVWYRSKYDISDAETIMIPADKSMKCYMEPESRVRINYDNSYTIKVLPTTKHGTPTYFVNTVNEDGEIESRSVGGNPSYTIKKCGIKKVVFWFEYDGKYSSPSIIDVSYARINLAPPEPICKIYKHHKKGFNVHCSNENWVAGLTYSYSINGSDYQKIKDASLVIKEDVKSISVQSEFCRRMSPIVKLDMGYDCSKPCMSAPETTPEFINNVGYRVMASIINKVSYSMRGYTADGDVVENESKKFGEFVSKNCKLQKVVVSYSIADGTTSYSKTDYVDSGSFDQIAPAKPELSKTDSGIVIKNVDSFYTKVSFKYKLYPHLKYSIQGETSEKNISIARCGVKKIEVQSISPCGKASELSSHEFDRRGCMKQPNYKIEESQRSGVKLIMEEVSNVKKYGFIPLSNNLQLTDIHSTSDEVELTDCRTDAVLAYYFDNKGVSSKVTEINLAKSILNMRPLAPENPISTQLGCSRLVTFDKPDYFGSVQYMYKLPVRIDKSDLSKYALVVNEKWADQLQIYAVNNCERISDPVFFTLHPLPNGIECMRKPSVNKQENPVTGLTLEIIDQDPSANLIHYFKTLNEDGKFEDLYGPVVIVKSCRVAAVYAWSENPDDVKSFVTEINVESSILRQALPMPFIKEVESKMGGPSTVHTVEWFEPLTLQRRNEDDLEFESLLGNNVPSPGNGVKFRVINPCGAVSKELTVW